MKIQEADAKTLLVAQGLPVPDWEVAHTVLEARAAAERILAAGASAVVIKAQVLVGGRGKAGGVKLASSPDEAEKVAAAILGMDIKGITVRKVLVAAAADIAREFYMSAVLDRAERRILLMGSAEGGVEIEQVAVDNPEAIIRRHADPFLGLGSTAIACAQLGLNFIGIELDEGYLNEAVERTRAALEPPARITRRNRRK